MNAERIGAPKENPCEYKNLRKSAKSAGRTDRLTITKKKLPQIAQMNAEQLGEPKETFVNTNLCANQRNLREKLIRLSMTKTTPAGNADERRTNR